MKSSKEPHLPLTNLTSPSLNSPAPYQPHLPLTNLTCPSPTSPAPHQPHLPLTNLTCPSRQPSAQQLFLHSPTNYPNVQTARERLPRRFSVDAGPSSSLFPPGMGRGHIPETCHEDCQEQVLNRKFENDCSREE
ncbi:hypothetical protein HELRODRAFT_171826 [Helobdella robusta]|uniref:Uncharacterized protein n=1 Tax=Helobdella robusta TaxID=6412 RepID=T1F4R0_HELRO|nr:hypothetical protein HELRODRAFT_171826 [Helobdella robusta]ESO05424.1 hypothetical protein HELRODRAFT_171826 [Helobdella robusta]